METKLAPTYGDLVLPSPQILEDLRRAREGERGSGGVDGITIEEIAVYTQVEAAWLDTLREEPRYKAYRSAPVRRAQIQKGQRSFTGVGHSHGERPRGANGSVSGADADLRGGLPSILVRFSAWCGAHQAVEAIREALRKGNTEVVDADLAEYFDTIPHHELMRRIARRVSDGRVLKANQSLTTSSNRRGR